MCLLDRVVIVLLVKFLEIVIVAVAESASDYFSSLLLTFDSACFMVCAEKLSVFFHVRVINLIVVYLCLCNVCTVHKNLDG